MNGDSDLYIKDGHVMSSKSNKIRTSKRVNTLDDIGRRDDDILKGVFNPLIRDIMKRKEGNANQNAKQVFWLQDPSILIRDLTIIPVTPLDINQFLNCLTRLVIILVLILFLMGKDWLTGLIIGILLILMMWYLSRILD